MRNALSLSKGLIVTTDNSGAIGQKEQDVVNVSDDMTSYFSGRVTLLEQWAAGAEPEAIILHNFSGEEAWNRYVAGIQRLFDEIGIETPKITGSTETNIKTLQSCIGITIIGNFVKELPSATDLQWFTYGKPLVGDQVVAEPEKIANLTMIYRAMQQKLIERIWPVGSKGIAKEIRVLLGDRSFKCEWDIQASAGPSTVILIGIYKEKIQQAQNLFGELLKPIEII